MPKNKDYRAAADSMLDVTDAYSNKKTRELLKDTLALHGACPGERRRLTYIERILACLEIAIDISPKTGISVRLPPRDRIQRLAGRLYDMLIELPESAEPKEDDDNGRD